MKRIVWLLCVSMVYLGCYSGPPSTIIKADQMEEVLYDIHIVDGYLGNISHTDSIKKVAAAYYDGIYAKFGIDSAKYNRSLNYYYKRPDDLLKMYLKIEQKVDGQLKAVRKLDSLKNAVAIRKFALQTERKEDSLALNIGYDLKNAERILYLERYKNPSIDNYIAFDVRKLDKDVDYHSISKTPSEPVVIKLPDSTGATKLNGEMKLNHQKNRDSLRSISRNKRLNKERAL